MTMETDLLAAITSREQLEAVRRKHSLMIPSVGDFTPQLTTAMYQVTGLDHCYSNDTMWPLQRDFLREQKGVYPPPTEVVKWMRTFKHVFQHFPHISREDPLMVAYTPDAEAGIRDKKVRIAIGRFIRKFFPLFTENAVRELEAAHRAELDPTLEIVTGFEAVERVYRGMAGDSGCMRYDKSHFGHSSYHPSAIYASPNFGVAVHRDGKGTVKSRAVVWVNPEDENDKRFVRIYGDGALQRKLERKGYKLRGLKGAKVLALKDDEWKDDDAYPDRFVVPYIDPAGGINYTGDKEKDYDARYVVRYDDDPDHLHLVTNTERQKLQALGVMCVSADSQSGSITVPLSARAEINVRCQISGHTFSRLNHTAVQWMNPDGSLGWANVDNIEGSHKTKQMGLPSGRMIQVYGLEMTFAGRCLPGAYSHFIDNADTMRINRLVRLDRTHYPEDESIYSMNQCVEVGESWIKIDDAYQVQEKGEHGGIVTRHVHKDSVRMLRKMGYVNAHPVAGGMKLLIHSSDERLVITAGGKKALRNIHELSELWDGSYDFTRNVESIYIGGFTVVVRKGNNADKRNARVPDKLLNLRIFEYAGDLDSTLSENLVQRQFMRYLGKFLHKPAERIVDASYGNASVTVETIIAAAREITGMTDQATIDGLHYSSVTLGWARAVMRCVEMSEERRLKGIEMAEANALLYEVDRSDDNYGMTPPEPHPDDALLAELDRVLVQPPPQFMRTSTTSSQYQTLSSMAQTSNMAITQATFVSQLNPAAAWPAPPVVQVPAPAVQDEDLEF